MNINIFTARSNQLYEQLKSRRLDITLSVDPKKSGEIIVRPLFNDFYSLYGKVGVDLKNRPIFIVAQAKDQDGITLQTHLKRMDSKLDWSSCDDFETVKAMVENGVGMGILPERVASHLVDTNRVEIVRSPQVRGLSHFGEHNIGLSYRKARAADPLILWLVRRLEEMLGD